jgi:holo-[acyl-carrier protein] synthase
MRIIGHGIDLVEVERIERMLAEHGGRMLDRLFTKTEQEECAGDARSASRFAARFAAKEAGLKALGTGLSGGIQWTDVSVANDAHGAPNLLLAGKALEVASGLGITRCVVSLSHTRTHAIASVIACGEEPR